MICESGLDAVNQTQDGADLKKMRFSRRLHLQYL
jgi:hypothetical protein